MRASTIGKFKTLCSRDEPGFCFDNAAHALYRHIYFVVSFWSSLLAVCEERASEKANKWWFHIYHTLQQSCGPEKKNDEDIRQFTGVLKSFVESSPLGEFSQRLNMLYSFYNQITIDESQHCGSGRFSAS